MESKNSTEPLVVTVDPSPSGGYYVAWRGLDKGEVVGCSEVTLGLEGLGAPGRQEYDRNSFGGWPGGVSFLAVEVPVGRPVWTGDGGMALLSTALAAGYILGHASALGIEVLGISPDEWRAWYGLKRGTRGSVRALRGAMMERGAPKELYSLKAPHYLDAGALLWYVVREVLDGRA